MSNAVNQCPNGHFFAKTLQNCPFCSTRSDVTQTQTSHGPQHGSDGGEKTQVMGGGGDYSGAGETVRLPHGGTMASMSMDDDSDRTIIQRPTQKKEEGENGNSSGSANNPPSSNSSRKLVGWLVSFSHDPYGTDYRLFEGQNKVGREANCSVRIVHDKSISSNHAIILFRNGSFYVKDEMAANPSFVNKIEIKPGATEEIKDGDTIDFGNTSLLFRKAFV